MRQLLGGTRIQERFDSIFLPDGREPGITHAMNLFSMIGLLTMGKSDYEAVEEFREDDFSTASIGITTVPTAPTRIQN